MTNPLEESVHFIPTSPPFFFLKASCTLSFGVFQCLTNVPLRSRLGEIELCATRWLRPSPSVKRQKTLLFFYDIHELTFLQGRGTGWGHWTTMHPLPYHRSHQYYPRPPHLPNMHVVLLLLSSWSNLWAVRWFYRKGECVIKDNLQIPACRLKSVTETKLQTCTRVDFMTSGEKHPRPLQGFHILISFGYALGGTRKEYPCSFYLLYSVLLASICVYPVIRLSFKLCGNNMYSMSDVLLLIWELDQYMVVEISSSVSEILSSNTLIQTLLAQQLGSRSFIYTIYIHVLTQDTFF